MTDPARITKKAERLSRALCMVESTLLDFDMRFDRAHLYWPEMLKKAMNIVEAQNLLVFFEDIRPLHKNVETANHDRELYEKFYEGPRSHEHAFDIVLGISEGAPAP